MNGVRSPAASKMWGDKKRQGIGVQGRDECLPFTRHGETVGENMCRQRHKGMPAFVGFWFPLCRSDTISHLGVPFAFGTDE